MGVALGVKTVEPNLPVGKYVRLKAERELEQQMVVRKCVRESV